MGWLVTYSLSEPPGNFLIHELRDNPTVKQLSKAAHLIAFAPDLADTLREMNRYRRRIGGPASDVGRFMETIRRASPRLAGRDRRCQVTALTTSTANASARQPALASPQSSSASTSPEPATLPDAAAPVTCSTCERGLIYGGGDECESCLLDTAIARKDINWLRYADAIDLAHKWFKRAEYQPKSWTGSHMALDAEARRWCETAATLAIILGDRIGEDKQQRARIPYLALNRYNLTGEICLAVTRMLDWKMGRRS